MWLMEITDVGENDPRMNAGILFLFSSVSSVSVCFSAAFLFQQPKIHEPGKSLLESGNIKASFRV